MTSRVVAAGWIALLAAAAPAGAQDIGYTASLFVAKGTYATDKVTSVYVFNSVDVTQGPVRVSLSVPFVNQRITFPTAKETYTGFGDPLIRADVRVIDDRRHGFQVALAGSVKPSFVDADTGRGTGAADYGGGASLFKFAGRSSVYADLMYWKYGDPEGVEFEDSFSYSVGMGRMLGTGRWSAMASLSGFSKGIEGAVAPLQLNVTMLALARGKQSVAFSAGFGLNDSSGDFSLGMSWRIAR